MNQYIIQQIREHQKKALERYHDDIKLKEKILKERDIFYEIQDMICGSETYPFGFIHKGYELDEHYVSGEFFVLLEKNLYEFDMDGNLKLIRKKQLPDDDNDKIKIL